MSNDRPVTVTVMLAEAPQELRCTTVLWDGEDKFVKCYNPETFDAGAMIDGMSYYGGDVLMLDKDTVVGIEGPRENIKRTDA